MSVIDGFCNGDPAQIKAVTELTWEEYWGWLDRQVRKAEQANKKVNGRRR